MLTILIIFFVIIPLLITGYIVWDSYKHPWKNPFRTVWKARKVFKRPFIYIYMGQWKKGGYYYLDNFFIKISTHDVLWKDKYNSPRVEFLPEIDIVLFSFLHFYCRLESPKSCDPKSLYEEEYYEQMIWWLEYSDKDIQKAKDTWPYKKFESEESTWINNFLKQKEK